MRAWTLFCLAGLTLACQPASTTAVPSDPKELALEAQLVTSLSPPSGLTARSPTHTAPALSWQPVTAATKYHVRRDGLYLAKALGTSYIDLSLTVSGTHSYTVKACNSAGCSLDSSPVQVIYDITPPPQVAALSATQSPTNAPPTFSWAPVSDLGGSGLAGYQVSRDGSAIGTVPGTIYTDAAATEGSHSYSVIALDNAGNASPPSLPVAIVYDVTPPSQVVGLSAATAIADAWPAFSWTASTDSGGSGLAGYSVSRDGVLIATVSSPGYRDITAVQGAHRYSVVAFDGAGNVSSPSASLSLTYVAPCTPAAITGCVRPDLCSGAVCNVACFGATGDGVHDDLNPIQCAVDTALGAPNMTIYFPRGNYRVNGSVQLNTTAPDGSLIGSTGLTLAGAPSQSVLTAGVSNPAAPYDGGTVALGYGPVIKAGAVIHSGLTVHDLIFDGAGLPIDLVGMVSTIQNGLFENCTFRNTNCPDEQALHCHGSGLRTGDTSLGTSQNVVVKDSTFENITTTNAFPMYDFYNTDGGTVTGCTFRNYQSSNWPGSALQTFSDVSNVTITGNQFSNIGGGADIIASGGGPLLITANTHNEALPNSKAIIIRAASNVTVAQNTIVEVDGGSNTKGIEISDLQNLAKLSSGTLDPTIPSSSNLTIANNSIAVSDVGIGLPSRTQTQNRAAQQNVLIQGNSISPSPLSGQLNAAISVGHHAAEAINGIDIDSNVMAGPAQLGSGSFQGLIDITGNAGFVPTQTTVALSPQATPQTFGVASTLGIGRGQWIDIDQGASLETTQVTSVNPSTLTITALVQSPHAAGASVARNALIQGAGVAHVTVSNNRFTVNGPYAAIHVDVVPNVSIPGNSYGALPSGAMPILLTNGGSTTP